jgi:hypothetical protein
MPRSKKPAAVAPVAPAIDPAMAAAIAAAVQAALAGVIPGTVAMATAAPVAPPAPVVMESPCITVGGYEAEGWKGKRGEFCVTIRRGRQRNGITFTADDQVKEAASPLFASMIAQCCKAAGKTLGGK